MPITSARRPQRSSVESQSGVGQVGEVGQGDVGHEEGPPKRALLPAARASAEAQPG